MYLQQNIGQILATIKAIQVQHENGYYISDNDFEQFNSAVNDINALYNEVVKNRSN
jgi:hypothetical protein